MHFKDLKEGQFFVAVGGDGTVLRKRSNVLETYANRSGRLECTGTEPKDLNRLAHVQPINLESIRTPEPILSGGGWKD